MTDVIDSFGVPNEQDLDYLRATAPAVRLNLLTAVAIFIRLSADQCRRSHPLVCEAKVVVVAFC